MSTATQPVPRLVRRITDPKAPEARRRLAVQRVLEGETRVAVAASLKVSDRSIRNGMSWYRRQGVEGLKFRPHPGPESKLSEAQELRSVSGSRRTPRRSASAPTSGLRPAS